MKSRKSKKAASRRGKRAKRSNRISLFENPNRTVVRVAKTTARRKGKYVAKDTRTGENVAHGSKAGVAAYAHNLYPHVAKPKYGKRHRKATRSNPSSAKKSRAKSHAGAASKAQIAALKTRIDKIETNNRAAHAQFSKSIQALARGHQALKAAVRPALRSGK